MLKKKQWLKNKDKIFELIIKLMDLTLFYKFTLNLKH